MLAEQVFWRKKVDPIMSPRLPNIPQVWGGSGSPDMVGEGEALLVKGVLHFVPSSVDVSGHGRLGL